MKLGFRYNRGVIIEDREKEESNWGEDSLKKRIGKEWNKFKSMSAKEKWQYFCSYYLLKLILLIIAVVAIVSIIVTVVSHREPYINGGFLNVKIEDEAGDYLKEGLDKYISSKQKIKEKAGFSGNFSVRFEDSTDYNNIMVFDTMLRGATFDYLICDKDSLVQMNSEKYQACMNIHDVIDDELTEELKLEFYTVKDSGGNEKDIAIKLDSIELLTKYNAEPAEYYLIFVPNGKHKEYCNELVEYLFGASR